MIRHRDWVVPVSGDTSVERVNGHPIFYLGWSAGGLMSQLIRPEETLSALAPAALWAAFNLEIIAADRIVHLPHSKRAAGQLAAQLRDLFSEGKLEQAGQSPPTVQERASLQNSVRNLDSLLNAELSTCDLYFISQKRAWDTTQLILNAEKVLSESAAAALTDQCKNDLRESGRCIAFDLPTASAFHLFRAIEAVVLQYFPVLRISVPSSSERNLGNYIRILREHAVDDRITGMLQHLKDIYRNPIVHPELFLEADEAENLFQFAASAIAAMVEDVKRVSLLRLPPAP
jgi:hypothetical protein